MGFNQQWSLQVRNDPLLVANGIDPDKTDPLQAIHRLTQAYNGYLQLCNELVQVKYDIHMANKAPLQAGNDGNSSNNGCCR